MKMGRFVVLASLLLLMSCAPGRPPCMDCAEIAGLREQIGTHRTPEEWGNWVSETYGLPLNSVSIDDAGNGAYLLGWEGNRGRRSFTIRGGSLETTVIGGTEASLDRTLECLGQPAAYRAIYEGGISGNELSLQLVFPSTGVFATGAVFLRSRPKEPPPIEGAFPISLVRIVEPGTTAAVLSEIYVKGWGGMNDGVLQQFKAWPGDSKGIVIGADPGVSK
jgi:hypothetical protein